MKKVFVLLLVLFFLSCFNLFGQALVFDAALNTLMTITGIDRALTYVSMLADSGAQLTQMIAMVENLGHQVNATMQNLNSIQDIKSWDDFVDFYNRQLYLEKQTMSHFENMQVSVGDKSFHLLDVEGIVTGIGTHSKEFWEGEYTEDQRRAMWLELGLTPSNYTFVQPFRQKALTIAREGLAARDIQNDWYVRTILNGNKIRERLIEDRKLPSDKKMGDKEVLVYAAETLVDINKTLNDMAMQNATMLEYQSVKYYLEQAPKDRPVLSDWPENGFSRLD